jgi:DNA repair protein SbcC/Rad50
MIPHTLHIKNFLSYGPETQTIEFAPHKLICLSGKNGHGKSALLDAITWALWGTARKTLTSVKPDEGLLHLGQTQMFVMLDFELNGVMYRVRREFLNTYGKPYANVDFGLYDPATDKFSPLTDKTIRKTQEKIEQTLHLSYDSFVNSAFLRQGHSNEFSKKSPKERKEILASILGLDQYETLRKLAAEKSKRAHAELNTLNAFQEKLIAELSKKEGILAAIIELENKLTRIAAQEKALASDAATLQVLEKKVQEQHKQHEMLAFEQGKITQAENVQQHKLRELASAWRSIHKKMLSLPDQATVEKQKKELMQAHQEHQQKFQRTLELKEQYLLSKEKGQQIADGAQKSHLKTAQEALITLERMRVEHASLELMIKELVAKKEAATHEQELLTKTQQEFKTKLKVDAELQQKLAVSTAQFEKRKAAYQQFITQANQLSSELAGIANKESLVHNDQDPSCPLCEQNLSASRRKFLKNKFTKDQEFIEHQLNRLSAIIKKLKGILLEQHAQLELLKKETDELKTVQIKLEESTKQSAKLQTELAERATQLDLAEKKVQESAKNITEQEKQCKEIETARQTILDTHAEYQESLKLLDAIVKEGKAIAYNQKQHQEVQGAIQALEAQIASHAALQAESVAQNQRKKEISELCSELKEKKKQKALLAQKIDEFKQYAKEEQELALQRAQLAQRTKETLTSKELLLQEQGSLQEQQKKLVQFEAEHKEQQKAIAQLHQTIFDYQTIATATGKDGIQALLIEEAIPEIEHEANYLLSRLTNNQAQIFIESLRDLKKGGTKETLDIKISDPAGIRPYEMFSGGEAFRIDFALRIAVSKLLARRAGTALQTLIIDEGFGSQDEEGLSNIMDCIHKIQDDFSLIIIVSHLSAMKDQFPVHFMVEKRAQASRVHVVELG